MHMLKAMNKFGLLFFIIWFFESYHFYIDMLKESEFPLFFFLALVLGSALWIGFSCFSLSTFIKQLHEHPNTDVEIKETDKKVGSSLLLLIWLWGFLIYHLWITVKLHYFID